MRWWQLYKKDFWLNLKLALPIMAGQLGQVSVNLADNLMVGRLGAKALAAVSVANAVFIIFMVIGMGISFALPPLISEADGAGETRKISQYFKHSLIINLAFGLVSMMLIFLANPILYHMGQDQEVVDAALPYLKITGVTLIPFMIFQTLRCYCDGLSNTLLPMLAIIAGNIINIALNYALIFGNWNFPAMGVSGAAMASLIARVLMGILLLAFILSSSRFWIYLRNINFRKYQKIIFRKIFGLGIPTSAQMFFEVTAFSGAALIMGMLGKDPQAAHQISINMASITFLICTGIAMASTIRVGNQMGKRSSQGLRNAGFSAILQVVIIMTCTALIFILFRHQLPRLYIDDPVVIDIASTLLILAAIFQIPDGIQVTALGALRGLQDVRVPTLLTFISYWILGIPVSYFAALYLGPPGVWLGLIIGLTASSWLLTYRFHRITKRFFEV